MTGPGRKAERWVRRWWRGEAGAPGALLSGVTVPLEGLFRAVASLRNVGYDRGWFSTHRAPVPVVSIGNLTVGGTGKTPMTRWVVSRLRERGWSPAVVVRGYGADEVALHRLWMPDLPVIAEPERVHGALDAAARGADLVVLDDGFQHRALARDLDIVLLAAEQPFPGARLPRGPFREGPESLRRADLVIVTRKSADPVESEELEARVRRHAGRGIRTARVRLAPVGWVDLHGTAVEAPRDRALVVASVGAPETVAALAAAQGMDVERMDFPDHHDYDEADARRIAAQAVSRPIVTTEKDAVKLHRFAELLPRARVLRLGVRIESGADLIEAALDGLGTPPSDLNPYRLHA